jgi:hypothetical protein
MGAEPTNGDGFGLGWYGTGNGPALYRSVSPAWADANLRELTAHVESPLFLAHVPRRLARRFSRPIATPFVAAAGCSFTTASSPTSMSFDESSCSRSTRRCSLSFRDRPTRRSSSILR